MTDKSKFKYLSYPMLVAILLCMIVFRNISTIANPIAGHEDGRDLLALFFNHRSWRLLFRYYAGYISFGPALLAYIASFAPTRWIPDVYTALSMLAAVSTLTVVLCDRSGLSAASRQERLIVAVMLIVFPLGKTYMFTNVTYSQWHMLFLLMLLLVQPVPHSRLRLLGWSLLIQIVSISNPLSILGLPLLVPRWREARTAIQRNAVVLCGLTMALYQIAGVQYHPLPLISLDSCIFACRVFLSRVIVECVSGPRLTTALEAHGLGWINAVAGLLLLIAWTGCRWRFNDKTRDFHGHNISSVWMESYFWAVAYVIVFIGVHLRYSQAGSPSERTIFLVEPNLQRYVYVPKLIAMYLVVSRFIQIVWNRMKQVSTAWRFMTGLLIVLYLGTVNIHNAFLYTSDPVEARRLKSFLTEVELNLDRMNSSQEYHSHLILDREEGWDIIIDVIHPRLVIQSENDRGFCHRVSLE